MLCLDVHGFCYIQQTVYSFLNHYSVNYLLSVLCIQSSRERTVTFSLKKMKHVLLGHLLRKTSRFPDRKNELKMNH